MISKRIDIPDFHGSQHIRRSTIKGLRGCWNL